MGCLFSCGCKCLIAVTVASAVTVAIILLTGSENGAGNTIQILLSDGCDSSSSLFDRLYDFHLFELNKNGADDTRVGFSEMFCSGSTSVVSTVPLLEHTDSNTGSKVHLSGDGGRSDVIPILTVRGEFLEDTGLDGIGPDRQFELVRVFQVLGIGFNESRSGYVTDANSSCFFGHFDIFLLSSKELKEYAIC